MKKHIKKILLSFGIIASITIGGVVIKGQVSDGISPEYAELAWKKPITDEEWKAETKRVALHIRFDYQLNEMKLTHEAKLTEMHTALFEFETFPDWVKYQASTTIAESGKTADEWYQEELLAKKLDYQRVQQTVELINKEMELRKYGKVNRKTDQLKMKPSTDREEEELNKLRQK